MPVFPKSSPEASAARTSDAGNTSGSTSRQDRLITRDIEEAAREGRPLSHLYFEALTKGTSGSLRTIAVTTRLDGSELRIPVHEVKGTRDGPTLTLVSTQHGAEWFSVEIVRRVIAGLTPAALRGRVVGIPVANPSRSSTSPA